MPDDAREDAGGRRTILGNFFSLSVVQFANYLAPLITLPYLFRVLGPSKYGLIEFARALSIYFVILTDYGFSLSATRDVSIHREDRERVSEIFSCVMLLKFLLVLLSFAILAAAVFAMPRLRADWPVYLLSFGQVVGMWLFPIWLFQGLERMKAIAVLNVAAKLLVIAAIFAVIRDEGDYLRVPLVQSAGHIAIGLAGLVLAFHLFAVRFRLPSAGTLVRELRNGWHLFLSRMATTLYTTSNVVILGLFTNHTLVGHYAAGDKIVRAVQGLQLPLSQAIFPHIGRLASQSRHSALAFASKVAKIVGVATLAMSVGLLVGAPYIVRVVLGEASEVSVLVVRILSFLPFIIGLSNVFGVQIMVNFGLKKVFTSILIGAGFLNLMLAVILVVFWEHVGVAVAALATEIFVTVATGAALRRSGLHVFRGTTDASPVGAECEPTHECDDPAAG
jgi:PST family polysaccharide transporter